MYVHDLGAVHVKVFQSCVSLDVPRWRLRLTRVCTFVQVDLLHVCTILVCAYNHSGYVDRRVKTCTSTTSFCTIVANLAQGASGRKWRAAPYLLVPMT